jgi:DNA-binding MltR family transcriptional regulator
MTQNADQANTRDDDIFARIAAKLDTELTESSEVFDQLDSENDRVAVIAGSAYLDTGLELLIRRFFVANTEVANHLLKDDRALGSFSSRINASYSLGLISGRMRNDLHTIRRIRNKFAHSHANLTFGDTQMYDLCLNLLTDAKRFKEMNPRLRPDRFLLWQSRRFLF